MKENKKGVLLLWDLGGERDKKCRKKVETVTLHPSGKP